MPCQGIHWHLSSVEAAEGNGQSETFTERSSDPQWVPGLSPDPRWGGWGSFWGGCESPDQEGCRACASGDRSVPEREETPPFLHIPADGFPIFSSSPRFSAS